MAKIRFNLERYDSVIDNGNVELQSINETIIFEGLGKLITDEAEREFFSLKFAGQRLNGFISEFVENHLQTFVDTYREEAQIITHFNN